jgi:hypothetical protein
MHHTRAKSKEGTSARWTHVQRQLSPLGPDGGACKQPPTTRATTTAHTSATQNTIPFITRYHGRRNAVRSKSLKKRYLYTIPYHTLQPHVCLTEALPFEQPLRPPKYTPTKMASNNAIQATPDDA